MKFTKNTNLSELSLEQLKELQSLLVKNKLLDSTYKNKARVTRDSIDGILGSRTKAAWNKYISTENLNSEETEEKKSFKDKFYDIDLGGFTVGDAFNANNLRKAINEGKRSGDKENTNYMPVTRSGKATAQQIADERLGIVGNYITEDFGKDLNYKVLRNIITQLDPYSQNRDFEKNLQTIREQYKKETGQDLNLSKRQIGTLASELQQIPLKSEYTAASRHPVERSLDFTEESQYDLDGRKIGDGKTVSNNQIRPLVTRKSETKIQEVQKKSSKNPTTAEYLTDKERESWSKNKINEVLVNAELLSQMNDVKTQLDNSITPERRTDLQKQYNALADRIALTNNASSFRYDEKSEPHDPLKTEGLQDYFNAIKEAEDEMNLTGKQELNPALRQRIQKGYDLYGVSPQYKRYSFFEKQLMDYLYPAGYSYYTPEYFNKNPEEFKGKRYTDILGDKFYEAMNHKFTSMKIDNSLNNIDFTRSHFREGVTNHMNQLGERLPNYKYNDIPVNAVFGKTTTPLFNVSQYGYFDPEDSKFHVALSENPKFNRSQMTDLFQTNVPYNFVNAGDTPDEQWNFANNARFNVTGQLGEKKYDYAANLQQTMKNAAQIIANLNTLENEDYSTGKKSIYRVGVSGQNPYDKGTTYSNHALGLQFHNGKPYNYTQDKYDFNIGKEIAGINFDASLFNAPYYRTISEVSPNEWNQIQNNAKKVNTSVESNK